MTDESKEIGDLTQQMVDALLPVMESSDSERIVHGAVGVLIVRLQIAHATRIAEIMGPQAAIDWISCVAADLFNNLKIPGVQGQFRSVVVKTDPQT